jgi:hypothetical protein
MDIPLTSRLATRSFVWKTARETNGFMAKRLLEICAVAMLLSGTVMQADSKNIADYKLRVHIFGRNQTTFYHNRIEEEAKGEGRANLFENGDVHGIDFSYECDQKLKDSFGYETYPARWKKPGQQLTVLLPVFGKSNTYFTCTLKTDVKSYTYTRVQGKLISESPEKYKAWMVRHEYDPENGKEQPVKTNAADPESESEPPAQ